MREAWDDPTRVSAPAVLRKAPTAKAVARMHVETLAKVKRPGDGGRAVGPAKAAQLKHLAAESVAAPELEAQVAFEMERSSLSTTNWRARLPRLRPGCSRSWMVM